MNIISHHSYVSLYISSISSYITAMKATMLSNDFATQASWSTYDDVVNDYNLESFSIERDLRVNGSLTFIKKAISAGFDGIVQVFTLSLSPFMYIHIYIYPSCV